MPYPSRVNSRQIVETAAALIEQTGTDTLSLVDLAHQLGVKAPSLYRYFKGRTALLQAVNTHTVSLLDAYVRAEAIKVRNNPHGRLVTICNAVRDFARAHPVLYSLVYTNASTDLRPDQQALETLVTPIEAAARQLFREEDVTPALRGLWAVTHGFVMLELSGQMWAGGDFDADFARILEMYFAGWPPPAAGV